MSDSILIVDDERGIRETLRGVLEDEGYAVEAVATGEDCLKALERRNFGCVLLDVWLPGIDGLETLARLKETLKDAQIQKSCWMNVCLRETSSTADTKHHSLSLCLSDSVAFLTNYCVKLMESIAVRAP